MPYMPWLFWRSVLPAVGAVGVARRLVHAAAFAFVLGSGLFSGSLYLHAFVGVAPVAWLTPVGGGLMILGWFALAASAAVMLRRPPAG